MATGRKTPLNRQRTQKSKKRRKKWKSQIKLHSLPTLKRQEKVATDRERDRRSSKNCIKMAIARSAGRNFFKNQRDGSASEKTAHEIEQNLLSFPARGAS